MQRSIHHGFKDLVSLGPPHSSAGIGRHTDVIRQHAAKTPTHVSAAASHSGFCTAGASIVTQRTSFKRKLSQKIRNGPRGQKQMFAICGPVVGIKNLWLHYASPRSECLY